jgi:hypothetical protein
MARVHRIDRADLQLGLRPPQKRADGSVRYDAVWTRAGVFAYRQKDGTTRREYRSPKEVGRADSLATLELAHVTKLHPPKMGLAKDVAVGAIGTDVKFVDEKYVTASCLVRDDATNQAVADGDMVETSCGYTCDYVAEPGISPEGEPYDGLQTNIEYEHGAIVPKGRAGTTRLRTDAYEWREDAAVMVDGPWSQAQVIVASTSLSAADLEAAVRQGLATVAGVTIAARLDRADAGDAIVAAGYPDHGLKGAPYVVITSRELSLDALHTTVTTALASQDVKVLPEPTRQDRADEAEKDITVMDELKKKLDAALAEAAAEKARADANDKKAKDLEVQLAAEKTRADKAEAARDAEKDRADQADKARTDAIAAAPAQVRARIKLEDTAFRVLGKDFKVDGADGKPIPDAAIKRAVTEKLIGKALPADATPAYIDVRFDVALEQAGESLAASAELRTAATQGGTRADESSVSTAHRQMVERQRKAGDQPLA